VAPTMVADVLITRYWLIPIEVRPKMFIISGTALIGLNTLRGPFFDLPED